MMTVTVIGAKAEVLPSSFYSEVDAGTFYLYNVNQGQFLERLYSNCSALTNLPAEVTLAESGSGYTIMFSDGKYLKADFAGEQYMWTNGTADLRECNWLFEKFSGMENIYKIQSNYVLTLDGTSGIYYANGINASISATADCKWALVTPDAYLAYSLKKAIPAEYRSGIPTTEGQYYIYDVLTQTFLNTVEHCMSETPVLTTITPKESGLLISGQSKTQYLKIGAYIGKYLWSDGNENNTFWTIESDGKNDNLFYIYSNFFTEKNAEVYGKTMYICGDNACGSKPSVARWVLIKKEDYEAFKESNV